jgi:hypothetical protein
MHLSLEALEACPRLPQGFFFLLHGRECSKAITHKAKNRKERGPKIPPVRILCPRPHPKAKANHETGRSPTNNPQNKRGQEQGLHTARGKKAKHEQARPSVQSCKRWKQLYRLLWPDALRIRSGLDCASIPIISSPLVTIEVKCPGAKQTNGQKRPTPPDIGDLSTRSGRSQPKLSPREAAGFAAAHSAPSRQQDHTKRPGLKVICTRRQLTIAQLLLGHSTHMPSQTLLRTTSRSRTDRLGTSCHSTSVHKHTIVLRIHWRIVQCHSLHQVTPWEQDKELYPFQFAGKVSHYDNAKHPEGPYS